MRSGSSPMSTRSGSQAGDRAVEKRSSSSGNSGGRGLILLLVVVAPAFGLALVLINNGGLNGLRQTDDDQNLDEQALVERMPVEHRIDNVNADVDHKAGNRDGNRKH